MSRGLACFAAFVRCRVAEMEFVKAGKMRPLVWRIVLNALPPWILVMIAWRIALRVQLASRVVEMGVVTTEMAAGRMREKIALTAPLTALAPGPGFATLFCHSVVIAPRPAAGPARIVPLVAGMVYVMEVNLPIRLARIIVMSIAILPVAIRYLIVVLPRTA